MSNHYQNLGKLFDEFIEEKAVGKHSFTFASSNQQKFPTIIILNDISEKRRWRLTFRRDEVTQEYRLVEALQQS